MGLRVDGHGLVTAGTDGGDACHRTYSVLLLSRLLWQAKLDGGAIYENAINQVCPAKTQRFLEPQPGLYIRHPDPGWTSSVYTCSRDQLTPVICFLATMANSQSDVFKKLYRKELTELLVACLKRGMFAQNNRTNEAYKQEDKFKMPDFINFELWAVFASGYVKSLWAPLAIPVMIFGDIWGILSALFACFAPINKDGTLKFRMPKMDDVDDMNSNNVHLARQYNFGTPFSWLARKIYKKFRRTNFGVTEMGEKDNIMGAIAYYNKNDNTDITELYRPLVGKY